MERRLSSLIQTVAVCHCCVGTEAGKIAGKSNLPVCGLDLQPSAILHSWWTAAKLLLSAAFRQDRSGRQRRPKDRLPPRFWSYQAFEYEVSVRRGLYWLSESVNAADARSAARTLQEGIHSRTARMEEDSDPFLP